MFPVVVVPDPGYAIQDGRACLTLEMASVVFDTQFGDDVEMFHAFLCAFSPDTGTEFLRLMRIEIAGIVQRERVSRSN